MLASSEVVRNRKETAWRKNRRFGDWHGGRVRPRLSDGIFQRLHALHRPDAGDVLPLLIEENPSRDFFFPVDGAETLEALRALPATDTAEITHVWLRRVRKTDYVAGALPLASFTCGSGVRLITMYPWPLDRTLRLGRRKPAKSRVREYAKFEAEPVQEKGRWCFRFSEAGLRRFWVEHLLFHEVGHHVDWYRRRWSGANGRACEEAADQYAMTMSATATLVLDRMAQAGGPELGPPGSPV